MLDVIERELMRVTDGAAFILAGNVCTYDGPDWYEPLARVVDPAALLASLRPLPDWDGEPADGPKLRFLLGLMDGLATPAAVL